MNLPNVTLATIHLPHGINLNAKDLEEKQATLSRFIHSLFEDSCHQSAQEGTKGVALVSHNGTGCGHDYDGILCGGEGGVLLIPTAFSAFGPLIG